MNAIILFTALALVATGCLSAFVYILIRDWRRERRSAWSSRFVDKRFTPDPRDWKNHFDQYDRPAILRRQAE